MSLHLFNIFWANLKQLPATTFVPTCGLLLGGLFGFTVLSAQADQTKANNNNNLELGASWVSGIAPNTNDNAIWDSTVATPANCTNTLGSNVTWNAIVINNPSAPVAINGDTSLTLNNGINMGNATVDLLLNCAAINLGSNQVWAVPSGRNLITGSLTEAGSVNSPNNGNLMVTKNGGGTWTTSGSGDNGSSGIIISAGTVNLNKTSSSGAHAVGGPGLTVNSGGIARITGTGGDQIYNGASVALAGGLFDLNGNNETFAGLNGSGVVDNMAAETASTLTLSNGTSTFNGVIQNSGSGATLALVKSGTGTITLGGTNSYTGGTIINGGTLALKTISNASMAYTVNSGVLSVSTINSSSSLPMNSLTFGGNGPQLTCNFAGISPTVPLISNSGNLAINGNVSVNVQNVAQAGTYVLLQYVTRSGTGSFVAGSVPAGAIITDDTALNELILSYASAPTPRVIVPVYNTNEIVVAVTTPQQYGAVADGVTDDSAAFQNAINAVYNSGGYGGGVIYVPPGYYAFSNSITIPTGVTLHGDWTDWTKGTNGLVGTTFCIYTGAGQANGTPFITMSRSAALRDINFWYPNQNPASITGYPFTISATDNNVIQDVVLVNSYQGIQVNGAEFVLSTVIGTPLFMGFTTAGGIADICHTEDIRFSPAVWPASLLPNAPVAGGSYATWMRTYGTGMQSFRLDGLINVNTEISGYNVGLDFEQNSSGQTGCALYNGWVTNCATALLAQEMQTAEGLEISDFTLDGDIAISRTHATNDAAAQFDHCTIIGRNGTAVSCLGADWQSSMSFQDCTISNTLVLAGPGVFNLVNCQLQGSTQCVMSASATAAGFTGCTFSPSQNIINHGSAKNLLIDPRQSISNAMPVFDWTNVMADFATRRPSMTNLFMATAYGATGNGVTDDTVAIQHALAAAGTNGGGIVYLPPGDYHVTNTLDVPSGVELRGPYELRHHTWPAADNIAKGAILQPYGGQGTTNGPPAIALEANAGLVGLTISYESQWTNCFPFPPAIQGRGGNIYMIGIQCPNPYYYVDMDTYTCTNHFLDMVDGWALQTGVRIGNGSSGTIADCHANWTFWIDNFASPHALQVAVQPPVLSFVMSNMQYYVLGNCKELFVKDFSIIENMYMHCSAENGIGPTVTGISAMCDVTYQCFVFDSTAPCTFNDVNPEWLVSLNEGYPGLTNQAAVLTTSNFQGTVHFFNSPIWGPHNWDYIINGGDVTMELVHLWQYAFLGTQVNGGAFHLINCGAFNVVDGGSGYPAYNLSLGTDAGIAGTTNEVIGCFSYGGWNIINNNVADPANIWMDYALSNYSVLDVGPVVIGEVYPNGLYQFQSSSALTFMTYSPNGINSDGITLQLFATNLLGQGYSTNLNAANGLAVTGSSTTRSVGVPLATNALYTAIVTVTDATGNSATNTVSFDTINPAYTFEAEDFDYNSGIYLNNPQTDAYSGRSGTAGIDYSNSVTGGTASYRPQGLETEGAGDTPRLAYSGGLPDYDVGFNSGGTGNWGNYTRTFPAGTYNIFMRAASPNALTTDSASMSLVTAGFGTTSQTTTKLGTFSVPNTGSWQTYAWVPLKTNSTFATFTGGSTETLRENTDNGGYNANFYMLVTTNIQPPWVVSPAAPTGVTATPGNAQVTVNWTASPDATSYDVMGSTTNGGPYAVIASNVTASVYTNNGLSNGTTYYYVISSVSALGQSANSAPASATPEGPLLLAASLSSGGQMMLSWPTNGNGGTMTPYYTPTLTPPITWVAVTNMPVLSNNQWNVTLPLGVNGSGFYRLQP